MKKKPVEPDVDSRTNREKKPHKETDKITELMNVLSDDVSVALLERIAETGTHTKEDIAVAAEFESLKNLKDLELIKIDGEKITLTKKGKKPLSSWKT